MNKMLSADDMLYHLHQMIDKKFGRTDRTKKINPNLLEAKMTLFAISEEFKDKKPELIAKLLKELVERGSVVTNLSFVNFKKGIMTEVVENEEGFIYPFDAYFIPKTEIINKEHFQIYTNIKNILHDTVDDI